MPAARGAADRRCEVFPAEINLTTARDRQSIVVQATFADGITRDVTEGGDVQPGRSALVKRDGATFYPAADGATTLTVALRRQDGRRCRSRSRRRPSSRRSASGST